MRRKLAGPITLALIVEFADGNTIVYPNWDEFITDIKRTHPRLSFGTMTLALPEWTAKGMLAQKVSSVGLMEDGQVLGKVTAQELGE